MLCEINHKQHQTCTILHIVHITINLVLHVSAQSLSSVYTDVVKMYSNKIILQ